MLSLKKQCVDQDTIANSNDAIQQGPMTTASSNIYAIGDLQGCYQSLASLLWRIALQGNDHSRCIVNALTRLRFSTERVSSPMPLLVLTTAVVGYSMNI